MDNQDYAVVFPYPGYEDALNYCKQDAMRALGIKLGELLESGDRFTVKTVALGGGAIQRNAIHGKRSRI